MKIYANRVDIGSITLTGARVVATGVDKNKIVITTKKGDEYRTCTYYPHEEIILSEVYVKPA